MFSTEVSDSISCNTATGGNTKSLALPFFANSVFSAGSSMTGRPFNLARLPL